MAWASAAYGFLDLPNGRAGVLVGYLAVGSFVSRLAVLGALEMFVSVSPSPAPARHTARHGRGAYFFARLNS